MNFKVTLQKLTNNKQWTRQSYVFQRSVAGYESVKSSVFNLRFNTGSDEDDEA